MGGSGTILVVYYFINPSIVIGITYKTFLNSITAELDTLLAVLLVNNVFITTLVYPSYYSGESDTLLGISLLL